MSTEPAPDLVVVVDAARDDPTEVEAQLVIPGLGSDGIIDEGPLERAVLQTLTEYSRAELLKPRDAGKVALALDLCRVMAGKRRSNRTSTYSNDARLLNEILDSFVAEETAGDAALVEAMQRWGGMLEGMGLAVQPVAS